MGKECPICGKWAAVKQNITVDGKGATKAEDVIAQVLSCGHTIGGEEYDEFIKEAHAIDKSAEQRIRAIRMTTTGKKAALWKTLKKDEEAGE